MRRWRLSVRRGSLFLREDEDMVDFAIYHKCYQGVWLWLHLPLAVNLFLLYQKVENLHSVQEPEA